VPAARLLIALIVAAGLLGACGDDNGGATTTEGATTPATTPAAGGDLERYCALTEEGDRVGREAFREPQKDPNATEEDFEQAERQFVEDNEDLLNDLQAAAPEPIREDVAFLVKATRAGVGQGPEVDQAAAEAAQKRTDRYERENCET
jgi:hypothetical protein